MMDGLAGSMMEQPQQGGMQGAMPSVEEIVALLMQGIDPQKLVEQGIPPELVMQAVEMLQQQMAAQQQAIPVEQQGGLAAQSMGM
jgi:hypothetical protein